MLNPKCTWICSLWLAGSFAFASAAFADECDIANCPPGDPCVDCDANGLVDSCELNRPTWNYVPSPAPSGVYAGAMAFHPALGRSMMYGADRICMWDGSSWATQASNNPGAHVGSVMAYDSARNRVVLFGGSTTDASTWEWDGTSWTVVATIGPSARQYSAMAYDSARGRVVMFGGFSSNAFIRETWEWDGTSWALRSTTGPSARSGHAMAYDAAHERIVLHGGQTSTSGTLNAETWEWDGASWTRRIVSAPSSRYRHAMCYDSDRGRIVLFGGKTGPFTLVNDTWEWNGSSWTLQAVDGPLRRQDAAMAYDSVRRRTVLFGGSNSYNGSGSNQDTWEWDGSNWTYQTLASPAAAHERIVYDSARDRLVWFGGYSASSSDQPSTCEWDGSHWMIRSTTGPTKTGPMVYDSARGRVVLHGLNDPNTWEWDGNNWALVATTGPGSTYGHRMAYDSARGRTVLFYGVETWEWDGATWELVATTGPSSRSEGAMAYDSARGRTVMFGGYTGAPAGSNETWEWDGTSWTLVATTGPAGRAEQYMAYHAARGVIVMYGGYVGDTDTGAPTNETWEWDGSNWEYKAWGSYFNYSCGFAYDSARSSVLFYDGGMWAYGGGDASIDCNFNDMLDACEGTPGAAHSGDMDGSGVVDLLDVPVFVSTLLTNADDCVLDPLNVADVNADGFADGEDIEPFVAALLGS